MESEKTVEQFREELIEKYIENKDIKNYVCWKTKGLSKEQQEEIIQDTFINIFRRNKKYLEKKRDNWEDEKWQRHYVLSMAYYAISVFWARYYKTDESKKEIETVPWPTITNDEGKEEPMDFPAEEQTDTTAKEREQWEFFEFCIKIHKDRHQYKDASYNMLRLRLKGMKYERLGEIFNCSLQLAQQTTVRLANELQKIAEEFMERYYIKDTTTVFYEIYEPTFEKTEKKRTE